MQVALHFNFCRGARYHNRQFSKRWMVLHFMFVNTTINQGIISYFIFCPGTGYCHLCFYWEGMGFGKGWMSLHFISLSRARIPHRLFLWIWQLRKVGGVAFNSSEGQGSHSFPLFFLVDGSALGMWTGCVLIFVEIQDQQLPTEFLSRVWASASVEWLFIFSIQQSTRSDMNHN